MPYRSRSRSLCPPLSPRPNHKRPMSEAMHQQTLPSPYCAFSTSRAYAAQHRNYGNCQDCKKAHQKVQAIAFFVHRRLTYSLLQCNGSDGSACDRCIKLKKRCSLLGAASPAGVNSVMESHTVRPQPSTRSASCLTLFFLRATPLLKGISLRSLQRLFAYGSYEGGRQGRRKRNASAKSFTLGRLMAGPVSKFFTHDWGSTAFARFTGPNATKTSPLSPLPNTLGLG